MKTAPLALALVAALASADDTHAAPASLTVYSGDYDAVVQSEASPGGPGFALYESMVSFDLATGRTSVRLGQLPAALDASSVRLRPRGQARVDGQRFDFALAGQDELLRRAIGQTVTVEQPVGDTRQTHTGVLMATGGGLTLRLPDGRVKVLSSFSSFELSRLPDGMVNEPTLAWDLQAGSAGRQDFDLAYATAGLAWRAEYQADLSGGVQACRMDLEGAAMVVNRSGADFGPVALTLVAGEPNRTPVSGPSRVYAREQSDMAFAAAPPAPEAVASGEYHAYRLPGTSMLSQGSVQRVPLLDPARGLACQRRYETRANFGGWRPPQPMLDPNFNSGTGPQPVIASLAFENTKPAGLGVPLPAGRVRVFDGKDLLGEASLPHTAAKSRVELDLGTVFDLVAERTREDFRVDRAGRQMEERVSVLVRNAKSEAAVVRVVEPLPRWSDWEVTASSVPASKRDAQTTTFDLPVPAGGEARLTYTVRYRWAPDVKID
ncbi:DUF4139 domain-containing protein [Arenimonas sp. MALMAid1274]|uniref:DUF4139 domain-containing protein n=1 Tax=Arenimonas sp. MALMAid1274 TaxID=3411630 RepID=UPI003BA22A0C